MKTLETNKLIRELFAGNEISEQELKRIYRDYCKQVHPDITGTDCSDFNVLQEEYKEARGYLKKLLTHFKNDTSKIFFHPRKAFYRSLSYYNAAGLHSAKIRLRKELKERNNGIIKEIIFWSGLYDPEFTSLFIDYNKVYLKSFNRWKMEKQLKNARKLFLAGFNNFLNYERNGQLTTLRTTRSFLKDALFDLSNVEAVNLKLPMINLIHWIETELQNPPALY